MLSIYTRKSVSIAEKIIPIYIIGNSTRQNFVLFYLLVCSLPNIANAPNDSKTNALSTL